MSAGRPLRIGFVAYRGNMQCGGQGIYLWFLARELARQGHAVDVWVGPPHPDPMPFAGHVERLPNQQFWAKWFLRERRGFLPSPNPLAVFSPLNFYELAASRLGFLPEPFAFSLRAFGSVASALGRGRRYDLIHDVQCLGYGLLGLRALGLPVVTTVHHPLSVDREASFGRDRTGSDRIGTMQFYPIGMQAFVARRLEAVLTSSGASLERIRRDFGVDRARLHMVGNGLDTGLYRPDPAVERSTTELLCVGRASDPNKGVRTLLAALARLPAEVRLTLVDDAGPGNPVRRWAREAGLADRLTLTGRVATEELVDLYRRAAIVVVPSRYEGFGLPAAEAMACGAPVVCSDAGALAEVVAAGEGVLVPRDDPEALAKALDTLLAQPEARARLAATARQGIVDTYSWPRVATRTVDVYRSVLEAKA